jgi:hypothetical protein
MFVPLAAPERSVGETPLTEGIARYGAGRGLSSARSVLRILALLAEHPADFEEIAEALSWDDFGNVDFEEIISTHDGRMVALDDRVILFANPEEAAKYIGFDLNPVAEEA